jgi:hypothetical protein
VERAVFINLAAFGWLGFLKCAAFGRFFYMFQGLSVNEFRSSAWSGVSTSGGKTLGVMALEAKGLLTDFKWGWGSVVMGLVITTVS